MIFESLRGMFCSSVSFAQWYVSKTALSFGFALYSFSILNNRLSTVDKSARANSVLIISISFLGLKLSFESIFLSLKALTT